MRPIVGKIGDERLVRLAHVEENESVLAVEACLEFAGRNLRYICGHGHESLEKTVKKRAQIRSRARGPNIYAEHGA